MKKQRQPRNRYPEPLACQVLNRVAETQEFRLKHTFIKPTCPKTFWSYCVLEELQQTRQYNCRRWSRFSTRFNESDIYLHVRTKVLHKKAQVINTVQSKRHLSAHAYRFAVFASVQYSHVHMCVYTVYAGFHVCIEVYM